MNKKLISVCITSFLFLILFKNFTYSKPWVWARFSKGNRIKEHSSFEKWHSYFFEQAETNDTVYLINMAWDDDDIYTINGINGDNSIGINHLAMSGHNAPIRLMTDGNYDADRLLHVWNILDNSIDTAASFKSYLTHLKVCYVSNKAILISSANHGRNGFNYQHNNTIILWYDEFPDMFKNKIEKEFNDEFSGLFHKQTSTGNIYYYSPTGDTVEMRFSPDDNNNGLEVGTESIAGRLRYLIENAKESIIYMANAWGSTTGDPNENAGNMIQESITNNNTAFKIGAKGSYSYGPVQQNLRDDHTCRKLSPMNDLHSKIFIIDMEIVSAGSANFSNASMMSKSQNDETNIIIHDFRIARKYMQNFHHIMNMAEPENDGQPDSYDTTPTSEITNLKVTSDAQSFTLNWDKPISNTSDFSRYYIFISDNPIYTNREIGDSIDDDGDGYLDEDPIGNIDRFKSGNSGGGTDNDDDADGLEDEDPWLFPEQQIKNINTTTTNLTSYNVGDSLSANTNYWFAVVSVDTQGNESICDTAGPYKLGATGDSTIIITELFYDEGDSFDWIEIYNNGLDTVNIQGWKVIENNTLRNISSVITNINGIDTWIIGPGQYAVISPLADLWGTKFSDTPAILFDAVNSFSLNLNSMQIGLTKGSGGNDTVLLFTYPDYAYRENSIELININDDFENFNNWQASEEFEDITPGLKNSIIHYNKGYDTNIIISEIMYDVPPGFTEGNDEWIEIYNKGNDTVSLSGWSFGYYSSGTWYKKQLYKFNGNLLIAPKESAVISENPDSWITNGYGDTPQTLIGLSSTITLSSSGGTIALFNSFDTTIEDFFYPTTGSNESIEKINYYINDYTLANWEAASYTNGETHTGGLINTVQNPGIYFSTPISNSDTIVSNIIVKGTTINTWAGDSLAILVNGVSQASYVLPSENSGWNLNITLSGSNNIINSKLYSQSGNIYYDTIYINYLENLNVTTDLQFITYDTLIQPMHITVNTNGTKAGDTLYICNVVDNSTQTIVLTSDNQTYYDTITLSDYGDTVLTKIKDKFNRTDSDFVVVYYFDNVYLKITNPTDYYDTFSNIITISGTSLGTDYGCSVTIYNNNETNSINTISTLNGNWNGTVSLNEYNDSIIVRIDDRFNRFNYDTKIINFFKLPELTISSPQNNEDTLTQTIIIEGTTNYSYINDTILFYVNGIQNSETFLTSLNGNFSSTVSLTGQNDSITVKLIDRFFRTVYDTKIINYFSNVSLGIQYPWQSYDTIGFNAIVKGTTYNTKAGDTVLIFVNNILNDSITITRNGNFSGTAMLTSANDTITATVYSSWTGTFTDTKTTHFLDTPLINITIPENNSETIMSLITISGTTFNVNGPDKIELYYNNDYLNRDKVYYIIEPNPDWQETINLNDGGNTIVAKLTDQFGRIVWDTKNITYYGNLNLSITSPSNNIQTSDTNILLEGTTLNSFANDTVTLYLNNSLYSETYLITNNDSWYFNVNLDTTEINILTVKITDKFNRTYYDTINTITLFNINCFVECDGFSKDNVNGYLIYNNSIIDSNVSDSTGYLNFESTAYDSGLSIKFSKNMFLTYLSDSFALTSDTIISNIKLLGGDFYNDGIINILDAALIKKYYLTINVQYDISGDSIVGIEEKNLIRKNFLKK